MLSRPPASSSRRFWVTCYTDASLSPKGAGWAVWLRSIDGRVIRSGPCPPYVKTSLEAEVAAIFAGIFLSHRTWGNAVRGVTVCTDCQNAIVHLRNKPLPVRLREKYPGLARLHDKVHTLLTEHDLELELRWVKGHQKSNTVQAFLNRACDRLAGKAHGQPRKRRSPLPAPSAADAGETSPTDPLQKRSKRKKNRQRRARARALRRSAKVG